MSTYIDISELFASYEEDYKGHYRTITQQLQATRNNKKMTQDQRTKLSHLLEEANNCIKQMEVELLSLPQSHRKRLEANVKKYMAEYEEIKQRLKESDQLSELTGGYQTEAGSLLRLSTQNSRHEGQQQRLLRSGNEVESQGLLIEDMEKTALETQQLAQEALITLKKDKESLLRTQNMNKEIECDVKKTHLVLNVMSRQIKVDKMLLLASAVMLGLIDIIVFISRVL